MNGSEERNISEKSLNLLLRRADWRFLLSNPHPKKTICFSKGTLEDAVELVSESMVYPGTNSMDNDCDLAVASDPDQKTLEAALNALKPGGACYIEWNVKSFFNPKTIRNKLESIGFDQIALYFPKPDPSKTLCGIWIPLEDHRAVAYFISESLKNKPKNIIRRAGVLLRSFIWHLRSKLFITLPWFLSPGLKNYTVCSIACKSSINSKSQTANKGLRQSSGSSEPDRYTDNTIEAKMKSLGLINNSNTISIIMLTEGISIYKKAILLVFSGAQNEPSFIIKMPRIAKSASELSIEADTLRTLQEKYENIKGIPKVLFSEYSPGYCMVAETFISGTPIDKILTKENYRELALKATELLIELADKTKNNAVDDSWDRLVKPILSDFVSSFGSVLHPKLIQQTTDIIKGLELTHIVCEHTDFSPWNVLIRSNGELGVLDWEGSYLQHLPVVDLVYFMTYLSVDLEEAFEPALFLDSYCRMLDESSYTGKVFKECIDCYCSKIGIPLSSIPALRLLTWLGVINWEYNQLDDSKGDPPTTDSLQDILYIGILKEELRLSGNN